MTTGDRICVIGLSLMVAGLGFVGMRDARREREVVERMGGEVAWLRAEVGAMKREQADVMMASGEVARQQVEVLKTMGRVVDVVDGTVEMVGGLRVSGGGVVVADPEGEIPKVKGRGKR